MMSCVSLEFLPFGFSVSIVGKPRASPERENRGGGGVVEKEVRVLVVISHRPMYWHGTACLPGTSIRLKQGSPGRRQLGRRGGG